jgi:hypothetical protein
MRAEFISDSGKNLAAGFCEHANENPPEYQYYNAHCPLAEVYLVACSLKIKKKTTGSSRKN